MGSLSGNNDETVYLYRNQDFHKIRHWCLERGYLFKDPYFQIDREYEWKRPYDIARDPQLFVGGGSRFDVHQGLLGNCWMLAGMSALAMHPTLVRRVVPADQSFTSQYAGIFHFRIWQFGKWFDVVIDDLLPTRNGRLAFVQSNFKNEFWVALLEKAYCKVLGEEYKAADAGNLCEALEDLTGGVVEQFHLEAAPLNFQNILLRSVIRHSLIGCFLEDIPGSSESQTAAGLVRGHSYSVTGAKNMNIHGYGDIVMVRVRNPWGKGEWTGPWSDGSHEWRSISESVKQELGLVFEDDGEFWMSYSDFMTNFEWVDMCHLSPDVFFSDDSDAASVSNWQLNVATGSWVRGLTAGGAREMHKNPQMRLTLSAEDDDNNDGLCSVLIALIQRSIGRGLDYNDIGFRVYSVDNPYYFEAPLDQSFFQNTRSVAQVRVKAVREVAGRFRFLPGVYCVIPYTYRVGSEGEFMIRVYTEKGSAIDTIDYRIGLSPMETAASEISTPMKTENEEDEEEDDALTKQLYDQMAGKTGGTKEFSWREVKKVLDYVAKNDLRSSTEKGDEHFLVDMVKFVYRKIFGSSKPLDAFKTIGSDGFSKDVCRSMVALLDVDHSGKLSNNELHTLWAKIKKWKVVYESQSKHNKGYLNSSGLKEALEEIGFQMNNRILGDIVHRYGDENGNIPFDDFLQCVILIKNMADFFNSKDKDGSHKAEFTLDEFLAKIAYS